LGAAQTIQSKKGSLDLGEVIPALVFPYATPECPILIGDLPEARLEQRQLDALSMVMGELAVNSTKHGALSAHGEVRVDARAGEPLTICWSERSDRKVRARHRPGGNGIVLMKRVLAACHGDIDVQWLENGLDATVTLKGARTQG
jgi:two-component sensor histidine kinase